MLTQEGALSFRLGRGDEENKCLQPEGEEQQEDAFSGQHGLGAPGIKVRLSSTLQEYPSPRDSSKEIST